MHEIVIKKFWTRVLKLTLNFPESVRKKLSEERILMTFPQHFCITLWLCCSHYLQVLINFSLELITIYLCREGERGGKGDWGDEIDILRLCRDREAKYPISYVTKWNIQGITLSYLLQPCKCSSVLLRGYRCTTQIIHILA